MAKKLIRIESASWFSDDPYINYSKALNFAFVGPEEKTNEKGFRVRTQVSKFVGCREILCKDMRSFVHNFSVSSNQTKRGYETDMETMRLLITVANPSLSKEDVRKRVFAGKRAVNLFEEYAGFSTQSVITSVVHDKKNYEKCWLMTGSKEWFSTPQLLSFMTLLLRCSYHLKGKLATDSMEELIAQFKSFKSSGNSGFPRDSDADCDLGRLKKVSNHILRVFDIREKLFFEKPTTAYDDSASFTDYGYGGISSLFDMATGQKKLNTKFKNLVLNYKGEKEGQKNKKPDEPHS